MRPLLILVLAAAALAQVCELDATLTFAAGSSQNIAQCTYTGATGQQRCLTGDQAKMLTMMNPDGSAGFWVAPFSFQILGPGGENLTQPEGWGTRCVGGCTGIGINSCFDVTSDPFTADFQFNCLDDVECKVRFNFTMYTYCGNGVCDLNENCFECPADCCPSASSSPTPSSSLAAVASSSLAAVPSSSASRSPALPSSSPSQSQSPSIPAAVAPDEKTEQSSAGSYAVGPIILIAAALI